MNVTTRSNRLQAATFALLLAALAACTGSSGPMAGIDGSGNPTPVAVVAQGPIEGFGSIIVNGIHYDVDTAQIRINGKPVTEADLRLGQLVTVTGERDPAGTAGIASTVVFEANVQGPVDLVDEPTGTLRVLGQTVTTTAATVVDLDGANDLGQLETGARVQVSGFRSADGSIDATRITTLDADEDLRVIGAVAALDVAGSTFVLGDLLVDYSQVLVIEDFPGGAPVNGDRVRVSGTLLRMDGALIATEIERVESELDGDEGQEAEIEGLITRFASPADFDVADTPVTTSAATRYEDGDSTDLRLGLKIHVAGYFDANGVIVATQVELED